ncbi:MAG: glycoside hydrolase family 99-like domain-containing protein [Marinilabiliaceae bacterium]|nr:glycoside hydrolase family 99-like domain-containing protein [Marinilabiliaceae bacterium]
MSKPRIIAYYLPQFHPFKENDEWWGRGFTEWTNVGKAKPLFRGHNQPRVPTELGYYDLRLKQVREEQVQLAREAGIEAFCYWHYWFGGDGRQLMNGIIDEVAATGNPDFPFCLGWANETWKAKQWNKDGSGDRILMEQRYEGEADYRKHYEYVRTLVRDLRYVRVDEKPFFLIYKPDLFKDVELFIRLWNRWIEEDGIASGFYFVANADDESRYDEYLRVGFNAVTPAHRHRVLYRHENSSVVLKAIKKLFRVVFNYPLTVKMSEVNRYIVREGFDERETVIPFLIPQWDHTPRSGNRGYLISKSSPTLFSEQVEKVVKVVKGKKNPFIMLKSWNEWAEGNYMEPDLTNGRGYINALKGVLKELQR